MSKLTLIMVLSFAFLACNKDENAAQIPISEVEILYTMPEESEKHEGTWLQWPHHYQHGVEYRNALDAAWITMTKELETSENVHIIAYNEVEKNRITTLLQTEDIPLTNIDFKIYKTDDVWVRDNGPIYVRDKAGSLVIEDWGFNGWGGKYEHNNCNAIPTKIASDQQKFLVDINSVMINEGGAIEIDGHGALMATKSAILNSNRNPEMTQAVAEGVFKKYLGITHFIWLDGKAGRDITDQHIDGFARFLNTNTIVTMEPADLLDFDVKQSDIDILYSAKDKEAVPYTLVKLPLTKNDVVTTAGKNLGYKGSYINYYIANTKVLVPNYNDPNDASANALIQALYPERKVVGIDVRNFYEFGGMIHCVTQQQPEE